MRIKTSELIGLALDWAVGQAQGVVVVIPELLPPGTNLIYRSKHHGGMLAYRPSIDWAQGGPIIERNFIETTVIPCGHSIPHTPGVDIWYATKGNPDGDMWEAVGPTPLIAAMRCYVVSKLGDEVDVPDKLCTPD